MRMAMSVRDTAADLDLGETTVWKLVREGTLKSVKVGARRLILSSSVDAMLRETSK